MHSISDQIRQGEKYGKTARKQIKRHTVNSFSTENDLNAEENGGSTIPVATGGGAARITLGAIGFEEYLEAVAGAWASGLPWACGSGDPCRW